MFLVRRPLSFRSPTSAARQPSHEIWDDKTRLARVPKRGSGSGGSVVKRRFREGARRYRDEGLHRERGERMQRGERIVRRSDKSGTRAKTRDTFDRISSRASSVYFRVYTRPSN